MNNKSQLVSVIMPVYNAESTLYNSIQSVLKQTYKDFELIVIDDGSTDQSWKIMKELAKKDNRIKLLHQENAGVSSARNLGLKNANGGYISFIDSDDEYQSYFLEKMKYELDKCDASVVMCGYIESASKRRISYPNNNFSSFEELKKEFDAIYYSTYLNVPWNKMFIIEAITCLFPEDISLGEDLIFNLNNIKKLNNIIVINDCLYNFTTYKNNSLTTRFHANAFEATIKIHRALFEIVPDHKDFLLDCIWRDYWRCIYKLSLNDKISLKEMKQIYKYWEKQSEIRWLRKNLRNIRCKSKYLYQMNNISLIRFAIKIVTQVKRIRSV